MLTNDFEFLPVDLEKRMQEILVVLETFIVSDEEQKSIVLICSKTEPGGKKVHSALNMMVLPNHAAGVSKSLSDALALLRDMAQKQQELLN